MTTALLDLLDQGEIREALAVVGEAQGPVAAVVRGWGRLGGGDPAGATAELRPLVEALEPGVGRGERDAHAHAVLALGVATVLAGDSERGMPLLERALTLHAAAWPRAQALRYCALALEQRGAWEGAAARYRAAAEVYRSIGHAHGQGSSLYGAATALGDAGEDATALLHDAVAALRRTGGTPALGAALGQLAAQLAPVDGPAALAHLEEAERLARDAGGMFAWDVRLRRAEVLLALGDPDGARVALHEARERVPAGVPDAVWVDHLLARAHLAQGETAAAAAILAESARLGRGPAGGLPGAAQLERAALELALAAREGAIPDAAMEGVERAVRAGWRRRGVAEIVAGAAGELTRRAAGDRAAGDRAARAWQLAGALGHVPPREAVRALHAAGAAIPLGALRLEERIGKGGMGEVWRATHRSGDAVAVKLLRHGQDDELAALFDAEVQAVARLDHPGIVRVLAAQRVDPLAAALLSLDADRPVPAGGRALVMELVDGGSLDRLPGPWTWAEAHPLLAELLAALAHAHSRGVLHLDLKPGNVLVDRRGGALRPRLTDFGLAGLARGGLPSPPRPSAAASLPPSPDIRSLPPSATPRRRRVLGTPAYMAPEQAVAGAPLSPATDLYALGCLAWRLVTGHPPFHGAPPAHLLTLHRLASPPPLAPLHLVPDGLDEWLRTLLAKRPEDRYACAADAAWALSRLGPAPARPPAPPGRRPVPDPAETFDVGGTSQAPAASTRSAPTAPEITAVLDADTDASAPPTAPPAPAAPVVPPFPADWRAGVPCEPAPFLWGDGEGLFAWRVGRLLGREPERDQLWAALGEVHATGVGRVAWVVGAEGMGRTALLAWLAEAARTTGAAWVNDDPGRPDRPRLLLLDDPSPAALDHHLGAGPPPRTLVVLSARAAPPDADLVLALRPLAPAEVRALLDDRLPLDRALATALAARAAGSPAFALALLTDLVRRDALEPGPEGFRTRPDATVALPDDLRSLWTARLDALALPGTPHRAAWEIAATFGDTADDTTLRRVLDRAGLAADPAAFGLLEREGWVARADTGLHFLVPAVGEALRAGAEASGRAPTWHGLLADRLPEAHPARGLHLAAAGRHAEALRPLRAAARDAVNATRLEECRALLDAWDRSADALAFDPDDPRRASPLVVRAHLALHTQEDPYPLLATGLRIARGTEEEAPLAYTLGWALAQDGRHAEAVPAYERALAIAGPALRPVTTLGLLASRYALGEDADALADALRPALADRPELLVRLDAVAGRGHLRLGRRESARELLEDAVEGARRLGAPDVEADALDALADLAPDPLPALTAAVAALAGTGSAKLVRARLRLASALAAAGRIPEARATLTLVRRFGWRLRPTDTAALSSLLTALDGR